jgi:hypothetical protein
MTAPFHIEGTNEVIAEVDKDGNQLVKSHNSACVCSENGSTEPLTSGSVFTGDWVQVSDYPSITIAVKTDQNGVFTIQFSPDKVNIDSTLTRYYRTTQIEAPHRFTVTRKYARVTFSNTSSTDQTYLRLQTILGDQSELNAPLDSTLAQDFDSTSVRPSDYHSEVALNRRQGASLWNKFGYNSDVDVASSPEIIASWGGTYQFITVGETIDIVSSSSADDGDPAGTGVNSIVVYGVDENWDLQTEVVTMNGTTTVTTSSSWIGINRIAVFLSGSGRTNAGTITVTATSSGYTMAEMPAGGGVSQQMIFFVPQNHVFLAEWVHFSSRKLSGGGGSPELTFKGMAYSAVNNTIQEVYRGEIDVANENNLDINPPLPFPIGEKSILYFTATTDRDNTSVTGRFSGELIRDVDA